MKVLPIYAAGVSQTAEKISFAGFDAIRAFAALGVVLLHACVPYLQNPMPGLAWPVRDTPSRVIDWAFWSIELFIMPVFLVLAGFLACQTLTRRSPRQLVTSRAKRLLLPLLFGVLVVLPLDLYAWVLGWVTEGLVDPIKLKSLKVDGELGQQLWGLSHLWFLQYLFIYIAITAATFAVVDRNANLLDRLNRIRPEAWAIVLVVLGVATIAVRPDVVWGFQHAFAPVASKWLYSGTFFAGGLLLAIRDPKLTALMNLAPRLSSIAICLMIATVALGRWHLRQDAAGVSNTANVMLAAMTTTSAWLITLSLIGMAAKRIQRIPVAISYLAAASFWVYLVHHPILGLVHTDLKWLLPTAPAVIKAGIALGLSVGVSLLSYEVLVRKTRLGRWLGFSWQFPATELAVDPVDDTTEKPAAPPHRRAA